jgi:hypothetical protein
MNFTSAGECGGNIARVEDGSILVGWPGAPGWTTTGFCAETGRENKHVSTQAAQYVIRQLLGPESLSMEGFTLSQSGSIDLVRNEGFGTDLCLFWKRRGYANLLLCLHYARP